MRISDWSSDVCSSDLTLHRWPQFKPSVKEGPILPDFDIRLASLSVGRLTIAKAVTGKRQAATLRGRVEILSGRARVDLRSEERRVGKAWVRTCRSRWSQ